MTLEQPAKKSTGVQTTKVNLRQLFGWIGGKRFVVNRIIPHVPKHYDAYVEPFLGSGTLLLALQPRRAIVNDVDPWLIMMWHLCCNHVDLVKAFTSQVQRSREEHAKQLAWFNQHYAELEKEVPKHWNSKDQCNCSSSLLTAALCYYYLKRTSYSSVVRFNSQGECKAIFAQPDQQRKLFPPNFVKVHEYLKSNDIQFSLGCYSKIQVPPNSLIYLDPPYDSCEYINNVQYREVVSQEELALWCKKQSGHIIMSNMATDKVKTLYTGWEHYEISITRTLNNWSGVQSNKTEALFVRKSMNN